MSYPGCMVVHMFDMIVEAELDLGSLLASLDHERRRVEARLAEVVAEADRRAAYAADGHASVTGWCRAGARYMYICEDGLVHYCSQQRGYPGVPLLGYTKGDMRREFLTEKSCAPNCTVSCVHMTSLIDFWRAPQTLAQKATTKPEKTELVNIQNGTH